ncbi:MAG: DUF1573 domain-containing protein [Odoribacteraceae bacterium]|jgi:hypothetical protein|nr:DUF1573 domain-containing protein [Odoribacteraceae bacterium]
MTKSLLFLLLSLPLAVTGQRPKILFTEKTHDFGRIEATGGSLSHTFTFVNKGSVPVLIIDAETSCGCTVPEWSNHPVLPGDRGTLTVNLSPAGLSGRFTKRITVYSSGNTTTRLEISGEVIARALDLQRDYPFAIGSLRAATDTIRLDAATRSRIIPLINDGKKKIAITSISKPGDITIDYTPVLFLPGSRGSLVFIYNPAGESAQTRRESVTLHTSEGATGTIHVTITPPR